jgi:hypothetical protein
MIKDGIKEMLSAEKKLDDQAIMKAISSIRDEIKNLPDRHDPGGPGRAPLPAMPTARRLFMILCENGRVMGSQVTTSFGKNNVTNTRMQLARMWRDNIAWKDRHGYYMPNPEMGKVTIEQIAGVTMTSEEFVDFSTRMVKQAIAYKFRPFSMLSEKEKKRIEIDLGLSPT